MTDPIIRNFKDITSAQYSNKDLQTVFLNGDNTINYPKNNPVIQEWLDNDTTNIIADYSIYIGLTKAERIAKKKEEKLAELATITLTDIIADYQFTTGSGTTERTHKFEFKNEPHYRKEKQLFLDDIEALDEQTDSSGNPATFPIQVTEVSTDASINGAIALRNFTQEEFKAIFRGVHHRERGKIKNSKTLESVINGYTKEAEIDAFNVQTHWDNL